MRVKVTQRGAIALPKELRSAIRPGSDDHSQDWFWSPRWQAMEREADEEFAAGRYTTFDEVEDFLSDLDADAEGCGER